MRFLQYAAAVIAVLSLTLFVWQVVSGAAMWRLVVPLGMAVLFTAYAVWAHRKRRAGP